MDRWKFNSTLGQFGDKSNREKELGTGTTLHSLLDWSSRAAVQRLGFIDRQKRDILPTPIILLIHCGANDLTEKDLTRKGLIENIECSVLRYIALFRNIVIVWSSLLQHRYWHFAPLNAGPIIDQKHRRVNSAVRTFVIENGGRAIWHDSNIKATEIALYRTDGTHLSHIGNKVFLNNLQGGLETFLNSAKSVFR
jgi:lysophospholipase L1-like esterase